MAAEIIESADMSADPCTDFYQVDFRGIELGLGSNWDLILIAVRVRRVAEEQPNPKWKVQLEHFQETLAGSRNISKTIPPLKKSSGQPEHTADGARATSQERRRGMYSLRQGAHLLQCLPGQVRYL